MDGYAEKRIVAFASRDQVVEVGEGSVKAIVQCRDHRQVLPASAVRAG